MISRRRMSAVLEAAPSFSVTVSKLQGRSSFVSKVSRGKYLSRNFFDQLGRGFGARQILTTGDIARTDQNVRTFVRRHCFFRAFCRAVRLRICLFVTISVSED